jgi:hypothetical protein
VGFTIRELEPERKVSSALSVDVLSQVIPQAAISDRGAAKLRVVEDGERPSTGATGRKAGSLRSAGRSAGLMAKRT